MGLWDSVNSVGFLYDRMFPYASHTNIVKHIRHGISIDERRGKFKQYPFNPQATRLTPCLEAHDEIGRSHYSCSDLGRESDEEGGEAASEEANKKDGTDKSVGSSVPSWSADDMPPAEDDAIWSELVDEPGPDGTTGNPIYGYFPKKPISICEDVVELWFPGDHADIGGGWAPNSYGHSVSNVTLRWMIVEAYKAGIEFKEGSLAEFDAKYPLSPSLEAPLHDKLFCGRHSDINHEGNRGITSFSQTLFWWSLECLPIFTYKLNQNTDRWTKSVCPNMGRHRTIPHNAKFHWSVSWRTKMLGYSPSNISHSHALDEWDDEASVDSFDDLKKLLDENPRL